MTAAPPAPAREAVFPPGVRHRTPFPFMRTMRADPLEALGRALREHGDAVGIKGGPVELVVLARPEYAHHVLIRNERNYGKGPQIAKLRRIAGKGAFFVDGDDWRRQRKRVVPAFQRTKLDALVPQLVGGADELVLCWICATAAASRSTPVPISRRPHSMGSPRDFRHRRARSRRHVPRARDLRREPCAVSAEHLVPVPRWIPTTRNTRMKHALVWVHGFVREMIERHRARDPLPDDLLGLLFARATRRPVPRSAKSSSPTG